LGRFNIQALRVNLVSSRLFVERNTNRHTMIISKYKGTHLANKAQTLRMNLISLLNINYSRYG